MHFCLRRILAFRSLFYFLMLSQNKMYMSEVVKLEYIHCSGVLRARSRLFTCFLIHLLIIFIFICGIRVLTG